ncbi:unnamed protein product [Bathycoccus prasinos]
MNGTFSSSFFVQLKHRELGRFEGGEYASNVFSASAFNHAISSWTGSAATSAQTDMFLDASAFQAKFKCTNADSGPRIQCLDESAAIGGGEC